MPANATPARSDGRGWAIMALNSPALFTGALNAVGFTSTGVAAGSLATVIQSTFYGPSTGGVFSVLQSVATKAILPPPVAFMMGAAALTLQISSLLEDRATGNSDDDEDDSEDGSPAVPDPSEAERSVEDEEADNVDGDKRSSNGNDCQCKCKTAGTVCSADNDG